MADSTKRALFRDFFPLFLSLFLATRFGRVVASTIERKVRESEGDFRMNGVVRIVSRVLDDDGALVHEMDNG